MTTWLPFMRVIGIAALAFVAGWICGRYRKAKEARWWLVTVTYYKNGAIRFEGDVKDDDAKFTLDIHPEDARDMAKKIIARGDKP